MPLLPLCLRVCPSSASAPFCVGLHPWTGSPSDLLALAKAPSWKNALFSVPVLCPAQFLWRLWLPQRPGSLFPALCTGWRWAGGEVSESPAGEALLMKLLQLPSSLLLAFPCTLSLAWDLRADRCAPESLEQVTSGPATSPAPLLWRAQWGHWEASPFRRVGPTGPVI